MTRPRLPTVPLRADERPMLTAFLDYYRADFLDRAYGLTSAQLQVSLPPSTLSLSRLIGHMTLVEYSWFQDRFDGKGEPEPYASLGWEADIDAEMTLAETWETQELLERFKAAVADSRARESAAESLDQLSAQTNRDGEHWSLRWILIHMVEEYARHCGHADLIRQSIDGDLAR